MENLHSNLEFNSLFKSFGSARAKTLVSCVITLKQSQNPHYSPQKLFWGFFVGLITKYGV
ncbi:MAG: hypothetical protein B7C24_17220 [Bacteroidetes bacterium 4572_77]|nr:MAG: hypothetical protein B7C24_17220 [Bacteroidetes bacterium 4572_77]